MADSSSLKNDSTFMDQNTSKAGAGGKRYTAKKTYLEPKYKTPGYVDGECRKYRGRNMESFCRQAKGTTFVPV